MPWDTAPKEGDLRCKICDVRFAARGQFIGNKRFAARDNVERYRRTFFNKFVNQATLPVDGPPATEIFPPTTMWRGTEELFLRSLRTKQHCPRTVHLQQKFSFRDNVARHLGLLMRSLWAKRHRLWTVYRQQKIFFPQQCGWTFEFFWFVNK